MSKNRALNTSPALPYVVGLIGLALGAYVCLSLLGGNDWNPSVFVKFPGVDEELMAYANDNLEEVVPAPRQGHDGKFFFIQAMDPFFSSPEEHAVHLDRPAYRAQRMLYPTIAGGFGLLPGDVVAWSMVVVNLLGLGVGTWITAKLAIELGLSAWYGLAFALNPGVLVSSFMDTGEIFAMAFFVAAAWALVRKRYLGTGILLGLSVLSRETMILAAIGAVVYAWREERKAPWALAVPFVAVAGWWAYVRIRLGFLESGLQDTQAVGVPFKGFLDAMQVWLGEPGREADMLVGILLMVASLLVAWRASRDRTVLGYMAAGFVVIALTMVEGVWLKYFDSTRALVPVITAYVLTTASSLVAAREKPITQEGEHASLSTIS
jgi:hypothetical protein